MWLSECSKKIKKLAGFSYSFLRYDACDIFINIKPIVGKSWSLFNFQIDTIGIYLENQQLTFADNSFISLWIDIIVDQKS